MLLCAVGAFTGTFLFLTISSVIETVHWRPAIRFGVPRELTADDVRIEYNGEQYFIPAGTSVFAEIW